MVDGGRSLGLMVCGKSPSNTAINKPAECLSWYSKSSAIYGAKTGVSLFLTCHVALPLIEMSTSVVSSHVYTDICTAIFPSAHVCKYLCMCTCIAGFLSRSVPVSTSAPKPAAFSNVLVYAHFYMSVHIPTEAYVETHMYVQHPNPGQTPYVCTYHSHLCLHVCIHPYMQICTCIHVSLMLYLHLQQCLHENLCPHLYICSFPPTLRKHTHMHIVVGSMSSSHLGLNFSHKGPEPDLMNTDYNEYLASFSLLLASYLASNGSHVMLEHA